MKPGATYVVLAPYGIVSRHTSFNAALSQAEKANAKPRWGMGRQIVCRFDGSRIVSLTASERAREENALN